MQAPFTSLLSKFSAILLGLSVILLCSLAGSARNTQMSTSEDGSTLIIDDAPEMQVIAVAKTVVVRGRAKEVFSWGGDVYIEGQVHGDVASIGGNVVQRAEGYIGGDVIVLGGTYKPESAFPLRETGKETVIFGVFESELREFAQNPSQIFSPAFTWAFFAQRLLSILFWFIVTWLVATIAPGAVGRSVARFQLSPLRVLGLGLIGFVLATVGSVLIMSLLPEYLAVLVLLMSFALLMLSYGFGRIALQVSVGRYLQRYFLGEGRHSEIIAILIGVVVWAVLLSIPFLWTLGVVILFATGVGLLFTSRPTGTRNGA